MASCQGPAAKPLQAEGWVSWVVEVTVVMVVSLVLVEPEYDQDTPVVRPRR